MEELAVRKRDDRAAAQFSTFATLSRLGELLTVSSMLSQLPSFLKKFLLNAFEKLANRVRPWVRGVDDPGFEFPEDVTMRGPV